MSRRRMKRRATQILVIAASVFVVVLIVAAVAIGLKSIKTLKSITLTPTFAETELDVDTDYQFKIKGNPAKANLKSLEYVVDDATATFDKDADSDKEMAILHTGAEGSITVYVKKGKVVSNKITLQVVDQVKKAEEEAEAQAAKEAEAAAAAEAAAQVEEEKIRLLRQRSCPAHLLHGDGRALRQVPAVDDHRPADELLRRELIEGGTAREQVGWRVHVGAGVAEHGDAGLLEAVLFIGVGRFKSWRLRARINGHVLFNDMGQVDDFHGSSP